MISRKEKGMYNISRCNMFKYIVYNNEYYRIVGFRILPCGTCGFIIIDSSVSSFNNYDAVIDKWPGTNRIFLNRARGNYYRYSWARYPLEMGIYITDKDIVH